MAKMTIRVDDVVLATKKLVDQATKSVQIKVPAYATRNGRAKTFTFDVGKSGSAELERMEKAARKKVADIDERAEADKKEAWRPIVELDERVRTARAEYAAGFSKKSNAAAEPEGEAGADDAPARENADEQPASDTAYQA